MTDADRLQQVEILFHDALARTVEERAAFLGVACAADTELLAQVNALLAAYEQTGSFMETPIITAAVKRLGAAQGPLQTGQRLGAYSIVRLLGRGGMGEVYLAADARLSRDVALKLLPAEFAGNADRRRRFEQEARAAGMLNHPNIVTVYDFGIHEGLPYIITELLEGQTLRARLQQGALPSRLAADYALQIARGLAAAHEKGVVHRDLKPENLFITKDGRVKILDFGLAKLQPREPSADQSLSKVATRLATNPGTIMGTMGYIAPEHLRQQEVDNRADIFVFGVVLYEMLTGQQAFAGGSAAEVMSAILKEDPPQLSTALPQQHPTLAPIARLCLSKKPEERFQSADDLVSALESGATAREGTSAALSGQSPAATQSLAAAKAVTLPRWQLRAAMAGLLVVVAAAVWLIWWLSRRPALPRAGGPVLKRVTSYAGLTTDPALSPDGKLVAYASDRSGEGHLDIWLQQLNGGEAIRLTRDEADDREPTFSPDGSLIAFRSERAGGGIYIVPFLGGAERLLVPEGRRPRFSPDGKDVVYWTGINSDYALGTSKSYVIAAAGGPPMQLQPAFAATRFPVWSPDGRHILFSALRQMPATGVKKIEWYVAPAQGGVAVETGIVVAIEKQGLKRPESPDHWLAGGNRVLFSARLGDSVNIWQLSLSATNWQVAGAAERLTFGAGREFYPSSVVTGASGDQLVFASQKENMEIWSLPIAADQGKVTGKLQPLTQNALREIYPSLSRDGHYLAFVADDLERRDVWFKDLRNGKEIALTSSPGNESWPQISQDGTQVVYGVGKDNERFGFLVPSSGGLAKQVCKGCERISDWSADGNWLLVRRVRQGGIGIFDFATGQTTDLLHAKEQHNLYQPHFSADGRWVTFLDQFGPDLRRLYIAPFLPGRVLEEPDWVTVTGGGYSDDKPRFAPGDNLLYFFSNRDGFFCIWAQRLDAASKQPLGAPFPLHHFHNARLSPLNMGINHLELSVAADRLVLNLSELTGEVWLAKLGEK